MVAGGMLPCRGAKRQRESFPPLPPVQSPARRSPHRCDEQLTEIVPPGADARAAGRSGAAAATGPTGSARGVMARGSSRAGVMVPGPSRAVSGLPAGPVRASRLLAGVGRALRPGSLPRGVTAAGRFQAGVTATGRPRPGLAARCHSRARNAAPASPARTRPRHPRGANAPHRTVTSPWRHRDGPSVTGQSAVRSRTVRIQRCRAP